MFLSVTLYLIPGLIHTDVTFGWKGYKNALTVFYMHKSEEFITEEHSYPLVPGLTPQINIETVETNLLGKPFTHCIADVDYSVTQCKYRALLTQIVRICRCFPHYMKGKFKGKFFD